MTESTSPSQWAIVITKVLNAAFGPDHFPINVPQIALDYSQQRYPHDPITLVAGDSLPGFDGGLFRAPEGNQGWGIIYNHDITSSGRINFTLAHEFGHYLLHRIKYPEGIRCGDQQVIRWDSELGKVEYQANQFAANLLMPLDDYRRQIDPKSKISLDLISFCANRYNVSLIAATLRWLAFTQRRAVLVVSRDGYILWAKSSNKALKSGAYFRTSRGPISIPEASLANRRTHLSTSSPEEMIPAGVWFREPCHESCITSDQYDFVISILQLENTMGVSSHGEHEDKGYDLLDRMQRIHGL